MRNYCSEIVQKMAWIYFVKVKQLQLVDTTIVPSRCTLRSQVISKLTKLTVLETMESQTKALRRLNSQLEQLMLLEKKTSRQIRITIATLKRWANSLMQLSSINLLTSKVKVKTAQMVILSL